MSFISYNWRNKNWENALNIVWICSCVDFILAHGSYIYYFYCTYYSSMYDCLSLMAEFIVKIKQVKFIQKCCLSVYAIVFLACQINASINQLNVCSHVSVYNINIIYIYI